MKLSRISRMVPASRTYNREHFMHQQCKLLNMIPLGKISRIPSQTSYETIQYSFSMYKKRTNTRNVPRYMPEYMPNNIAIALRCHCEHIVSISPFSYASQGFSWCCIPQIFTHVISMNATIENRCNFIHNVRFQLMHVSDYAPDTIQFYPEDIRM